MAYNYNVLINGLDPRYPPQPGICPSCDINEIYQSLPPSSPNYPTEFVTTAVGPSSIKHIYTGVPNYYPYQTITKPIGTMYEHDYSQFHETGVGRGKRISYQSKMYPLTNRNVRETHDYSDRLLPYMDLKGMTHYPIVKGMNLNSPLQVRPRAFD